MKLLVYLCLKTLPICFEGLHHFAFPRAIWEVQLLCNLISPWFCQFSSVAQSCPTLCEPMDYIVHGILQARILEWVVFPFSRGSSQSRNQTQVSHIAGWFFTSFKCFLCNHHHLLMGLKTCWKEQGPRSQGSLVLIPHTNYVPLVTSAPLLWTSVLSSVMGDNIGNPCLMA